MQGVAFGASGAESMWAEEIYMEPAGGEWPVVVGDEKPLDTK